MTCRHIDGLKWVKAIPRPAWMRKNRPRGVKLLGVRYERLVGIAIKKHYPEVVLGQWFAYEDRFGKGWAQTDVLMRTPTGIVVVECKLTRCEEAREQIDLLYRPLLTRVFELPVIGIVVVRSLTQENRADLVVEGLSAAISEANGTPKTVQWLGKGRI